MDRKSVPAITMDAHFFEENWFQGLVSILNSEIKLQKRFARAGVVKFCLREGNFSKQGNIEWDAVGLASLSSSAVGKNTPTFTSDETGWRRFINGDQSAVTAMLNGSLQYRGPLWFPMKYAAAFDLLVTFTKHYNKR